MSAKSSLHLFFPGVFVALKAWSMVDDSVPGISSLLAVMRRFQIRSAAHSDLRNELFSTIYGAGFDCRQHYAALCWAHDFGEKPRETVLIASPVHVSPGLTSMCIDADLSDELSPQDARGICDLMNAHFQADGIQFRLGRSGRLYARMDQFSVPDGIPCLDNIAGLNLLDDFAASRDYPQWNRILNDMQMLLFDHTVNREREAAGQLPVNSLWLWGGGSRSSVPEPMWSPEFIVGKDADAEVLSALIDAQRRDDLPANGDGIVLLDACYQAWLAEDLSAWEGAFQQVVTDLQVIISTLDDARVDCVLHSCDGHCWQATRSGPAGWFRRKRKRLEDFFPL